MGGLPCSKVVIDYRNLAASAEGLTSISYAACEAFADYGYDDASEQGKAEILALSDLACKMAERVEAMDKELRARHAAFFAKHLPGHHYGSPEEWRGEASANAGPEGT